MVTAPRETSWSKKNQKTRNDEGLGETEVRELPKVAKAELKMDALDDKVKKPKWCGLPRVTYQRCRINDKKVSRLSRRSSRSNQQVVDRAINFVTFDNDKTGKVFEEFRQQQPIP